MTIEEFENEVRQEFNSRGTRFDIKNIRTIGKEIFSCDIECAYTEDFIFSISYGNGWGLWLSSEKFNYHIDLAGESLTELMNSLGTDLAMKYGSIIHIFDITDKKNRERRAEIIEKYSKK